MENTRERMREEETQCSHLTYVYQSSERDDKDNRVGTIYEKIMTEKLENQLKTSIESRTQMSPKQDK